MGNKPVLPKCAVEANDAKWAEHGLKDAEQKLFAAKNKLAGCDPRNYSPPAPTQDKCRIPRYKLNRAQQDLRSKQNEMDNCDTAGALQRKLAAARADFAAFAEKSRSDLASQEGIFRQAGDAADKLRDSAIGLYKTLRDLEIDLVEVRKQARNYEQLERRERRAFLDGSPQSGVGGAPGVRTSDDRVLLSFWITYGTAILALSYFGIKIYEKNVSVLTGVKTRASVYALALLAAYSIAYPLISNYG